ncbi:MAG: cation:proton antiporter, partial [Candidatus Limnocylindria bacterium]
MTLPGIAVDLALAVVAAFLGGAIAQRAGLPAILGYLVAGVVIGPLTPGPTADPESVSVLAEIGIAFLMFALGSEFARPELRRFGRVASILGTGQILATMALGPLLAIPLGLTLAQGVFLGAALALSSTVVALKVLMERGEAQALHGRVALGILIVQDLAVVPMVVLLPALAGGVADPLALVLLAAKALAVLAAAYLIGVRAVPWILARAAVPRSRELFLLAVVSLALGTAVATAALGLSFAFGAFLAGLVVAESEFRTQVVAEILPLRDLFISLFFVSIGMLMDPRVILADPARVALVAGVTVAGKLAIVVAVALLIGLPGRVAVLAGLAVAQIGEFSFLLAGAGLEAGAISHETFDLVLAVAAVTIVLAPFLMRAAPALLRGLRAVPGLDRAFAEPAEGDPAASGLRRHTVICGFGRMGRELADALEARGLQYLVIEYNPQLVRTLR